MVEKYYMNMSKNNYGPLFAKMNILIRLIVLIANEHLL